VRYKLENYPDLRKTLLDNAVKVLKDLGFGVLLEINMHKFWERNFAIWAASLCKPVSATMSRLLCSFLTKTVLL
jgi:hypothetical protein